jgi:hypothetical protein
MKVRQKSTGSTGQASRFNTHGLGEIFVGFDDGDMDSMMLADFDVFLPKLRQWKDMRQAFADKDIIPDNYNVCFGEPLNDEDRERGYY